MPGEIKNFENAGAENRAEPGAPFTADEVEAANNFLNYIGESNNLKRVSATNRDRIRRKIEEGFRLNTDDKNIAELRKKIATEIEEIANED